MNLHYLFKFSTRTWHQFGFCLISLYQFDQLRFIIVVVLLMWLVENYVVYSVVSEFILIIIFGKFAILIGTSYRCPGLVFCVPSFSNANSPRKEIQHSQWLHWDPTHERRLSRAPHVFPMFLAGLQRHLKYWLE